MLMRKSKATICCGLYLFFLILMNTGFAPDAAIAQGVTPASKSLEKIRDWSVECFTPAINGLRCQILFSYNDPQSPTVGMKMSLAYIPAYKRTQVQFVLPLGFLIKRGATLTIGNYSVVLGVDRCTNEGCFVEGVAAAKLISAMRKGVSGTVKIFAADGSAVILPFSLNGFTKGFQLMRDRNKTFAPVQ